MSNEETKKTEEAKILPVSHTSTDSRGQLVDLANYVWTWPLDTPDEVSKIFFFFLFCLCRNIFGRTTSLTAALLLLFLVCAEEECH